MLLPLLQDLEDSGRRLVAGLAARYAGCPDGHAVAEQDQPLGLEIDDYQRGSAVAEFRRPDILTRFQRLRDRQDGAVAALYGLGCGIGWDEGDGQSGRRRERWDFHARTIVQAAAE